MVMFSWLKDPKLVASFQKYFGVEVLAKQENSTSDPPCTFIAKEKLPVDPRPMKKSKSTANDSSPDSSLYKRMLGHQMVGASELDDLSVTEQQPYKINNIFWFNFFTIASLAGDEIFYTLFFPFWHWNIDGAVIRRVIVCWMLTMYTGQVLKDMLQVPRPACPPVVRLDTKWVLEYGLPSTHAAVSLALPAALLIFSSDRYQVSWPLYSVFVAIWCLSVSASRLYLGMHTWLDVICGLLLAGLLLITLVPLMDVLDHAVLTHPISPLVVLGLTVAMVAAYPATASWNPARGDTAVILGVGCGTLIGAWVSYQIGTIAPPPSPLDSSPPSGRYPVLYPSFVMLLLAVLRTLLGIVLIVATRFIARSVAMHSLCAVVQVSIDDYLNHNKNATVKEVETRVTESLSCKADTDTGDDERGNHRPLTRIQHCFIECGYKLITYIILGFVVSSGAPIFFKQLGIDRPTVYTEV